MTTPSTVARSDRPASALPSLKRLAMLALCGGLVATGLTACDRKPTDPTQPTTNATTPGSDGAAAGATMPASGASATP